MKPQDIWDYYGTCYKFGKDSGMSSSSLINWTKWGYVPEDSQYRLERITKGKLKHEPIELKENVSDETKAFMDLKTKIVKLMFSFTNKYAAPGSSLYPRCGHILVEVLEACLNEAQFNLNNKVIND
jgi:hypothetical protein